MPLITPADANPLIAMALGRFSQACNYLEDNLIFTITRLLPITTDMGRVLLAGNQMRRNIEILQAILLLPEIPIPQQDREKLASLIPPLRTINEDRSRFLHNTLLGGSALEPGKPPEPLLLKVDKQDAKGSAMYQLSIEIINQKTDEVKKLYTDLYISPVEYDLSSWSRDFQRYPVKEYQIPQEPRKDKKDQK